MPQGPDFSPLDVGETVLGAMDFAKWLAPGVSIASVTSFTATNIPVGGAPCVTPTGPANIGTAPPSLGGSGSKNTAVLQQWRGMVAGSVLFNCTIVTSDGQTLIGWAHGTVQAPS